VLVLIVAILLSSSRSVRTVRYGSVLGTVRDSTGAVVPARP
jgi:hypothetical protein